MLATSQLIVERTLAIFSRQYTLSPHIDSSTAEDRQTADNSLLTEVLPQINVHFLAMTPMERHFAQFCYINHNSHKNCDG